MFEAFVHYLRVVVPTSMESMLLAIGAAFGTWISVAVGGFDDSFLILCAFMLADIITGSVAAWKTSTFKTKIASQGLFKKIFVVFIVMVCEGVDVGLHVAFLRDACVMGYILIEALSIFENIDKLGYGHLTPSFIKKGLSQYKEQKEARFSERMNENND